MRRIGKSLLVAMVLTMGSMNTSCATAGKEFPSQMEWIKEGVTKKKDVQLVLGEPYSVGNSGGRETWTYGFYRYKLIGKSHTKELKVYWNPDGTVGSFSFTSSFPDDTAMSRIAK